MSNRRRPALANRYRTGYLTSPAWFARRDRWFRENSAAGGDLRCAGCRRPAPKRHLELHHVSYDGVVDNGGSWQAREQHGDLIPMHPACHELLHRLIDRDPVLSRHRSRQRATELALRGVHARFGEAVTSSDEQR